MGDNLRPQSWVFDMFILSIENSPHWKVQSLYFGLSSEFSELVYNLMESFLMCSFGRVFRFFKASYNALTSSFIAEQKIRWCNAKRRRQREQQKDFARPKQFFQFLCRCFAWLQHETFSELHPLIKTISHVLTKYFVSCAPFCFFFSIAAHFHLAGR